MVRPWRALHRARGWAALAGLQARPDKFGGVSVNLAELRQPFRLERATFGRWLRGKCRAGALGTQGGEGVSESSHELNSVASATVTRAHPLPCGEGCRQRQPKGGKVWFPVPYGRS